MIWTRRRNRSSNKSTRQTQPWRIWSCHQKSAPKSSSTLIILTYRKSIKKSCRHFSAISVLHWKKKYKSSFLRLHWRKMWFSKWIAVSKTSWFRSWTWIIANPSKLSANKMTKSKICSWLPKANVSAMFAMKTKESDSSLYLLLGNTSVKLHS